MIVNVILQPLSEVGLFFWIDGLGELDFDLEAVLRLEGFPLLDGVLCWALRGRVRGGRRRVVPGSLRGRRGRLRGILALFAITLPGIITIGAQDFLVATLLYNLIASDNVA